MNLPQQRDDVFPVGTRPLPQRAVFSLGNLLHKARDRAGWGVGIGIGSAAGHYLTHSELDLGRGLFVGGFVALAMVSHDLAKQYRARGAARAALEKSEPSPQDLAIPRSARAGRGLAAADTNEATPRKGRGRIL